MAPLSTRPADLEAALNALFEQNLPDLYEQIEAQVFRSAYRYCHGNQLQTARMLGISRNIVRARLEKLGELEVASRAPGIRLA
ncbi:global DNA-binding transcriptional dual regulator Fis [compost metagenome]